MKNNGGFYYPIAKIESKHDSVTHRGITRRNKLIDDLIVSITSACIEPGRPLREESILPKIENQGLALARKIADLVIKRTTFEDDI